MNAELIKDARIIADSIHVHSSFQDWEAAEKDTLEKCADALETDDKRIAELERILKAVQENSGINFRMWQEAEAQLPKEGEWKHIPNSEVCVCSACSRYWIADGDEYDYRYCPNCGAKMKGEQG